jgi:hypothetical protein
LFSSSDQLPVIQSSISQRMLSENLLSFILFYFIALTTNDSMIDFNEEEEEEDLQPVYSTFNKQSKVYFNFIFNTLSSCSK